MYDIFFLIVGIALLVIGGDLLVRGAVAIAERLSIPPLIIGLTIVSLGTSAPELFISVQAALAGSGGLAIGNVVGSNIANVLLVLGIPALIMSTRANEEGIGRNVFIMIVITIIFMAMLSTGTLGLLQGIILLGMLSLFLFDQYSTARRMKRADRPDYHDEVPDIPGSLLTAAGLFLVGIILLPLGAWLTVDAAQNIARFLGVPDEIIGLTIVAIGTSLPELAASLMAVLRGNPNVAIGNVVGSNVFNIAAIMGITAVITPVAVSSQIIFIDMWIMLGASLWLAWLAYYKKRISTRSGIIMSGAYIAFMIFAFLK